MIFLIHDIFFLLIDFFIFLICFCCDILLSTLPFLEMAGLEGGGEVLLVPFAVVILIWMLAREKWGLFYMRHLFKYDYHLNNFISNSFNRGLLKNWNGKDILIRIKGRMGDLTYIRGIALVYYSREEILQKTNYNSTRYKAKFIKFNRAEDYIAFEFSVFTD